MILGKDLSKCLAILKNLFRLRKRGWEILQRMFEGFMSNAGSPGPLSMDPDWKVEERGPNEVAN